MPKPVILSSSSTSSRYALAPSPSPPKRSTSALRVSQPTWPGILPTSMPRRPCARPRREGAGGGSQHDIDQPIGNDNHFARGCPGELADDLVRSERERLGGGAVEPARRGQSIAQLAIDLNRERHLVVDQHRR